MITIPYKNIPGVAPSPVLDIEIESTCQNPPTPKMLSAIIDTGCDFSIIPRYEAKQLNLIPKGVVMISFGGPALHYVKYEIKINVPHTQPLPKCYVAAYPTKEIILGRNIINYWKIELNGSAIPIPTLTIY